MHSLDMAAMLALLLLPFLAHAQNSTNSSSSSSPSSTSFTVITSTSLSTLVSGGNTVVATSVFTTVQPVSTSNSTTSSNSTGNATTSTSSTPTTTIILPTAPTSVNAGASGGAPSPGQAGGTGVFGPGDNTISAAAALAQNGFAAGLVGSLIGGALVLL